MTVALYRRYRPETFSDVIGQEHVTHPLMQALRTGRVNHAYLFSGPRGCGKTTSARILARCLNCEQGPTDTPCGQCESCVALARGGPGTVDVIEIDAASHGGVDDARDLRERASYGPAQSRYKIYIIDEAHMVTPQGFNALLKIVEEPPEHVKFVFATTEPEKVIGTIRSRTHHYPFRLVPPGQLQDYLERLCAAEGVQVAPGVLSFVIRAGGGSVRDSLSVLDQLMAGSGADGLTYESAAALLGFTDAALLDATIDALAIGDAPGSFSAIEQVIESGLDPRRFIEDLLERLRDLIVISAIPDGSAAVLRGLPDDQLERMRSQATIFGVGALSRAADLVNTGLTEMTGATAPRLQLELIVARILLPGAAGESGYAARLDRLERRVDMGALAAAPARTGGAPAAQAPPPSFADRPAPPPSSADRPAPPLPASPPQVTPLTPQAPHLGQQAQPHPASPSTSPSDPRPAPTATAQGPAAPRQSVVSAPGVPVASRPAPARPSSPPASGPRSVPPRAGDTPPAGRRGPGGVDVEAIRRAWPGVLSKLYERRRITWTFVSQHAQVLTYDGDQLTLGISTAGLAKTFQSGAHATHVREALIDVLGIEARVLGVPPAAGPGDPGTPRTVAPILPPRIEPTVAPPAPTTSPAASTAPATSPTPSRSVSAGSPAASPALSPSVSAASGPSTPTASAPAASAPAVFAYADDEPPPDPDDEPYPPDDDYPPDPDRAPQATAPPEHPQRAHGADSPLARARASLADEPEPHVVDDTAISEDDEDVDLEDEVGVNVVSRILGATVMRDEAT